MKKLLLSLLFVAAVSYAFSQSETVTVTFNVDATEFAATDEFDPATDKIYISGDVLESDWSEPGTNADALMTDDDNDQVYTWTAELPKADTNLYYKYFLVPEGEGSSWNYGEWDGDPNRVLMLNPYATTKAVDDIWGVQEKKVTFNVDMTLFADTVGEFDPANDTVYVSGEILESDWNEPGTNKNAMMTDEDGDTVYTWVTYLPPDSTYAYKYFYVPAGEGSSWGNGEWDGDPNRAFNMGANDTTLNQYWASWMVLFNVTDGSEAIEGATVMVMNASLTTDADGMASYPLTAAEHDYTITADGFEDATGTVTVDYAMDTVDVAMTEEVTAIGQVSEIENLKLYPNPSNGYVTISGQDLYGGTVDVMNAIGARIKSFNLTSDKRELNLGELTPGVYFLKIEKGQKQSVQKLIIK